MTNISNRKPGAMSEHQRLAPSERTEQILCAAIDVAKAKGYMHLTRELVAEKAGCSVGLVTLRFSTMIQLRRAVMRRAIKDKVLPIIAQGVAAGDKTARDAPPELRKQAVASLA